ncbi:MAG: hypothetical protein N2V75_00230 [Methanophagales archaeon]|nr:hypothetical protein [Methanophagales archaeon]
MRTIVVNLKDISTDNPTLCLSPLRFVNRCDKCEQFRLRLRVYGNDIETTIRSLKCKPRVEPEILELYREKAALLRRLNEIRDRLNKW